MSSQFILRVFLYENLRLKSLPISSRKILFRTPGNIYTFIRSVSNLTETEADEEPQKSAFVTATKHFKEYFFKKPEYKHLVLDPNNLNFETEGRPESVHLLKYLINNPEVETLEKLISTLENDRESLDFEEICKSFFLTSKIFCTNEILTEQIVTILEKELHRRTLSRSDIIKALFALYEIRGKKSKLFFQKKMLVRLSRSVHKLSREQAVVFFYCLFKPSRETLKNIYFRVVYHISENIHTFDIIELGIVARGLLRANFSCYHSKLKVNLMKRTTELLCGGAVEEDDDRGFASDISMRYISKLLQRYTTCKEGNELLNFQESLIPHVSKFKKKTLINILEIGTRFGCLNLCLWENVAKTFKENISDLSLSDIERLVCALTECNVQDEKLLDLAIGRFENECDNLFNKRDLVLFLSHLIHFKIYPKKLIDVVFAESFSSYFKTDMASAMFKVKFCEIVCTLEIDKPEFKCKSLTEEDITDISAISRYVLSHSLNTWPNYIILNRVNTTLSQIYGGDCKVFKGSWHPLHAEGLFMRFDRNFEAQPIPEDFMSVCSNPRRPLKDGHIWVYIMLLQNDNLVFGLEKPKLRTQTQIRHLQALGYDPITVSLKEYKINMDKKDPDKETEFLTNIMRNHFHKISQENSISYNLNQ